MTSEATKERNRLRAAEWYRQNKAYASERARTYRKKNANRLRIKAAIWRKNNKESTRAKGAIWRKNNKESIRTRKARYYRNNAERIKTTERLRRRRKRAVLLRHYALSRHNLRIEVLTYYGHGKLKCCLCSENRLGALHIDHKNGGGKRHRHKLKRGAGIAFYTWLKSNKFPEGYRTLCANCNWLAHLARSPISTNQNHHKLIFNRVNLQR